MKRVVILLVVIFSIQSLFSQNPKQDRDKAAFREDLYRAQLSFVKREVEIYKGKEREFDKIYRRYVEAIWSLNPKRLGPPLGEREIEDIENEKIEQAFIRQTDRSVNLLLLRKEFFYEFKRVISPRDIVELYRLEREMGRKFQNELRRRKIDK